ncbi:MFS transporter [Pseudomonas koreensis]|jgi:EmrB/QacA subfamily drug resistance transporter|uniref:EmrB/QacA subfamily drug resistance transporter n=1 Tax=Pseudomonas helmanticensis TaxID=1471381 RepID=A0A4R7VJX2_9PSED|nr:MULTISPECIES: DHA2 family efflux MFS transporter permease subunit [Pseudomonas]OFJ44646.1 MFS transporter [Pseudomonas koreensis]TDV49515.1 EmrB/QacA subfamily drug resistance transporter [Pseudomonas helmanticensis]WGT36122.1 DHA2 family efflux MFS transporter permease subunit [Pseudomonas atacamensis]
MQYARSTQIALLVAATFFMENLDATVIATALPDMAKSFGVAPVDLNVAMSSYMLALAAFIPISGWLADKFGARRVFCSAIALFTLSSLWCGLSHSMAEFIAARILQGFSGAMMVPVGRLAVLRTTDKKDLAKAISYITTPALIAPVLGPPLGGFIVTHARWEWIFFLNLPLGVIALLAAMRLIPDHSEIRQRPFDWLGFMLLSGSCFMVLYGLERLGENLNQYWHGLLLTLIGVAMAAGAVMHMKRRENPLLNLEVIGVPTFRVSLIGASLFRVAISTLPFLLPLMFQLAFGLSAFDAGLLILAVFAGNLAMKSFTTPLLNRWGFRKVLIVNGAIGALAVVACALFESGTHSGVIIFILFAGGLSRSLQFSAYNTLAFADVAQPRMSDASTIFSMAFQLSMGMGVAIGALLLRTAMAFHANEGQSTAADFHLTFLLVAVIAVVAMFDSFSLKQSSGESVLRTKA